MKLSIIIPVYNEQGTILEILRKINDPAICPDIEKEIIVVDDCSTDGTRDIIRGLDGGCKPLFHDFNQGKGAAVRTGLKQATGDFAIIQDADLEYDPADYNQLIEPLKSGQAKIVYGVRPLKQDGSHKYKIYLWGGNFLTWLACILYGHKLTDINTCYKVFKRDAFPNLNIRSNRFDFDMEITAKFLKSGHQIYEVPISYASRTIEEGKKIKWRDGFRAIYALLIYRFID